jgi:hypothetical protein
MGQHQWWVDHAWELVKGIWEQYGLFAVLLVLGLVWHERSMTRLWLARLADKDKEIERLVKQRNRLEDAVLAKRLTSQKK